MVGELRSLRRQATAHSVRLSLAGLMASLFVVVGYSTVVSAQEDADETGESAESRATEFEDGESVSEPERAEDNTEGEESSDSEKGKEAKVEKSRAVGVSDSFLFRPEFRTDIPLLLGGGLQLEFPGRIRGSVSVGSLPTGYIKTGNLVTTGVFKEYNETQAQLVEDAVESSLVWRFHGGMRPMRRLGLYVAGGYTLATLGGRSTSGRTIDELVEADIPEGVQENFDVDATSTLHMLDVEVGWEFFRRSIFNLRTGIGWSFTIAANAKLDSRYEGQGPEEQAAIDALESQGEQHLVESYKKYVHPPYLSISAGFGF